MLNFIVTSWKRKSHSKGYERHTYEYISRGCKQKLLKTEYTHSKWGRWNLGNMVNLYHCFQFYDYSFSPHKIMFAVRLPALTVSAGAIPKAQSPKHYKTYGKRDRNHCEYCHVSFDTFPGLRQHEVKTHRNEESKKKQRPVNQRWRYSKTLLLGKHTCPQWAMSKNYRSFKRSSKTQKGKGGYCREIFRKERLTLRTAWFPVSNTFKNARTSTRANPSVPETTKSYATLSLLADIFRRGRLAVQYEKPYIKI